MITEPEMSLNSLLTSVCLPQLRQAAKIHGEYYWNGGDMGNPALKPLVSYCQAPDIVVVQINPTHREGLPCTAPQILDRLNEINFNANLLRELHRMAVITRLVERGEIRDPRVRSVSVFTTSSTRRRGVS